jgi:hypothetical protein
MRHQPMPMHDDGINRPQRHQRHPTTAPSAPTRSKSRPWLLSGGKPGYCAGKLHVQIRRAFAANPGQPLPSGTLMARCYPRLDRYTRGHYRHVWRAAIIAGACCRDSNQRPRSQSDRLVWILEGHSTGKILPAEGAPVLGWCTGN